MEPIRKINTVEKNNLELKKIHELQNKIMEQRRGIGLTKGLPDIRKRQFIKKGILGIIMGIGIAVFSKIARAGGIKFYGESDNIIGSSKGVAKVWASWTGTDTVTLLASYGVSSIADVNVGQYTVNFSTNFSSDDYAQFGWQDDGDRDRTTQGGGAVSKTTSAFQAMSSTNAGAAVDSLEMSAGAFGDQ
jgi:hypothetical protein